MYKFDRENCLYKEICPFYNDKDNCIPQCHDYIVTNYMLENSNIPLSRRKRQILTAPECDIKAYESLGYIRKNIEEFVGKGENLYIFGKNARNGKTSWAINLMLKYFASMAPTRKFLVRGIFVPVPMFLQKCKDNMNNYDVQFEQFRDKLKTADLVIWDDIAKTNLSTYDANVLYTYISERLLNNKSNIYTGNMNSAEMDKWLGYNLSNCIKSNLYPIRLDGEAWGNDDFFANNK